jgi:hypothetical protein
VQRKRREVKRKGKILTRPAKKQRSITTGKPRPPARRPPQKSLLETQSIFELIMPWKSDLEKMNPIPEKTKGSKGKEANSISGGIS